MDVLYQGALAPAQISKIVSSDGTGIDMTTVTDGWFMVHKPNGSLVSWHGALSAASVSQVTITYVFAAIISDLDQEGLYNFFVRLAIPGGFVDTEREQANVKGTYEFP